MNIHEHQAKEILKDFGVPVSKGIVIFSENDIAKDEKPFIDLFRSCLYPNFARSLESLSTLDWDMT